jgi:cytidylate kinase
MATNNKKYYTEQPIILGLAGKAATGKTSVAEQIVPKAQIRSQVEGIFWDHIFFALPLYELAAIRKNIKGNREQTRKLFALHETLFDIYGKSSLGNVPSYDEFVELVYDIYHLPIEPEGFKPRSFLQQAGDLCRKHDPRCFANWGVMKAVNLYRSFLRDLEQEDSESNLFSLPPFCVIISDVRFENEAAAILKNPNGIVVCYDASDQVRQERIFGRDGVYMTSEQMMHKSENEMDAIKEMADLVINTDDMSIQEQTSLTIEMVKSLVGINA